MNKRNILIVVLIMLSTLAHSTILSTTKGLITTADSHGVVWTFTGYSTDNGADSACVTLATLPPAKEFDGVLAIPGTVTSDGVVYYKVRSVTGLASAKENILGSAGDGGVTTLDLSAAEHLTSINNYAFFQFNSLTGDLIIPNTINYIGDYAFYNTKITSLQLNDNITYLGNYSFGLCKNLIAPIYFPPLITRIGDGVFVNCTGLYGELNIPEGVTYIGDDAFNGCTSITDALDIPSEVNYIGELSFNNCMGLTGDVVIPENVKAISRRAFYGCINLTSITYKGNTLDFTSAEEVFSGCKNLQYIDMTAATTLTLPSSTASFLSRATASKPFYNLQPHTIIYLPNSSKMSKSLVGNNANYVYHDATLGWTCPSLSLLDAYPYRFLLGFTAVKGTYDRSFTAVATAGGEGMTGDNGIAANTVYLPCDFSLPSTMSAYEVTGARNDVVGMTQVPAAVGGTTTLKGNTPYVVRFNDGTVVGTTAKISIGANAKVLATVDEEVEVNGSAWVLRGTTGVIDNATAAGMGAYNMENNAWHPIVEGGEWAGGHVGQFRCYLIPATGVQAAAPQALGTSFTAVPAGVGIVGNATAKQCVYTIGGVYVGDNLEALPRGVYVVNGRKVVK